MEQSIEERVKELVAEQFAVDVAAITTASRFAEDLGGDSLDTVELMMAVEDEFVVVISDEDSAKLKTVLQLVDHVTAAMNNDPDGDDEAADTVVAAIGGAAG